MFRRGSLVFNEWSDCRKSEDGDFFLYFCKSWNKIIYWRSFFMSLFLLIFIIVFVFIVFFLLKFFCIGFEKDIIIVSIWVVV